MNTNTGGGGQRGNSRNVGLAVVWRYREGRIIINTNIIIIIIIYTEHTIAVCEQNAQLMSAKPGGT